MRRVLRRFEVLLPTRFNDGQPVPDELIGETLAEVRATFHAASSDTQLTRGSWEHEGKTYWDELVRVFVDVPDTQENLQFFVEFKEKLKARFQQLDIWITSYPVEVI